MAGEFNTATKMLVMKRAKGRCDRCGLIANTAHWHHRRARGMGGTVRPETATPANCLFLHPACHDYVEKHRAESLEKGWLVRQADDPRTVKVLIKDEWCYLHDEGSVSVLSAGAGRGSPLPR